MGLSFTIAAGPRRRSHSQVRVPWDSQPYFTVSDIRYKNLVRTSLEKRHVSAAEANLLMLFGETVAVYCENHTKHITTLCGQNAAFNYVPASGTYRNH
jgi:hypothetical protein